MNIFPLFSTVGTTPSPAFMDEFEKMEQELAYFYDLYILKFRCLVYLEQQLEDIEKSEFDQLRVCNILPHHLLSIPGYKLICINVFTYFPG